jgi:hypothetical protein
MESASSVAIEPRAYASDSDSSITRFIDRWIYVFMAGLLIATALVGFIPDSLSKIGAVQMGRRGPFPAVLHVHAALMGSWLCLLFAQSWLMATHRPASHRKLGMLSLALMPAIVATGFILLPTMREQLWQAAQAAPPAIAAQLQEVLAMTANILLLQLRVGILFPLFVVLALLARRKDPGTHKRLMILAAVLPIPAAIDRMTWLPATMPESAASTDLYMLLWAAPMFAWDLYRSGRVHRAYVIWFGVNLPFIALTHTLWGSQWWAAMVPRIVGVGG